MQNLPSYNAVTVIDCKQMNVYVEYVILDNMTFDCLLLTLAALTLKIKAKVWRIALGGVIGTACAFVSPLLGGAWLVAFKFACVVPMCAVVCGRRKLLRYISVFCAYTFASGGAITAMFNLLDADFSFEEGYFGYYADIPLGMYVLGVSTVAYLAYAVAKYVGNVRRISAHIVEVDVEILGKHRKVKGFLDSGNVLSEGDVPVCFAMGSLKKTLKEALAEGVLCGTVTKLYYTTMSGNTSALAVKCNLTVNNCTRQVYLAYPKAASVHYEILLNAAFLEVQNENVSIGKKVA
ncbi:MAG: sigma-E processing peptidase SpoIIGA [Corallococcus sp.]|nr:sigma-E processing peptidase SpoIIGA [Corallococcus sp.]